LTEKQILKRIGLSDNDATDLIRKRSAHYAALNEAQTAAVGRKAPSVAKLAKAMGPNCTPQNLNDFVAARLGTAPNPGVATSLPSPLDQMTAKKK
jgi:hypothetical protein